jgi:hypothetical protein
MQNLNVPTATVSEVKKSPGKIFERAAQANNGVYVFNRAAVAGIMLTQEQYESLNNQLEDMAEQLYDLEVLRRLKSKNVKLYPDAQVRGSKAGEELVIDPRDGWE